MAKKRRLRLFQGDRALWIIIGMMLLISLVVIYSSTVSIAHQKMGGDTSYFLFRQLNYIMFSIVVMFVVHLINFRFYARYTRIFFYVAVIAVLIAMLWGISRNEAARWIKIPFFNSFQPSELLKVTLMMVLAVQLGKRMKYIKKIRLLPDLTPKAYHRNLEENRYIWNEVTKPLLFPVLIATGVVFVMNLSTALLIFAVSMATFFVAGIRFKEIMRVCMVVGGAGILLITVMYSLDVGRATTWVDRVVSYVSFDGTSRADEEYKETVEADFQKEQALMAIASGGESLIGQGPGNSIQRTVLPLPYSDFVFAVIVEEYGVIGAIGLMMLFIWMFSRCCVIARRSRSATLSILVIGLGLSITIQAMLNIMVCVGLLPVTGQPLPLISMGGTSLAFTCFSLGIILSVSRQTDEAIRAERRAQLAAEKASADNQTIEGDTSEQDHDVNQEFEDDFDYERDAPEEYDEEEEIVVPKKKTDSDNEDEESPFELVDRGEGEEKEAERESVDLY